MIKQLIWLLCLLSNSSAFCAISLRLYEADANTPFDCNVPVMVGTRLTIFIDSNSTIPLWLGGIDVNNPAQNPDQRNGTLIGREWSSELLDYVDSHLPAAGNRARTIDWENQDQQSFEFQAGGSDMIPGPWFVVDYNATAIGDSEINLVEYRGSSIEILASQTIHQVASRDFNNDSHINFLDFSILASYWMRTDCTETNNCGGTDINPVPDGTVDVLDLMYFADYWLGQFRNRDTDIPESNVPDINVPDNNSQIPPIYLVCDTNTPDPNQEITIYVHSDAPLMSLGIGIQIIGDANISAAMSEADCQDYGWDNWGIADPYIDDANGYVALTSICWASDANDLVGYFKLIYHSGQITAHIDQENSSASGLDQNTGTYQEVPFSTDALIVGYDPNQP